MRLAVEDHHALEQASEVGGPGLKRGHAREAGELVHELLQPFHLLDDGGRRLLEQTLLLRAPVRGQAAAQALGRELDRRERVLDLVGDALGHLAPGGEALGLEELGQVVEDEDHAEIGVLGSLERGGRGEERHGVAFTPEVHLSLQRVFAQPVHALDECGELRVNGWPQHGRGRLAERFSRRHAQHSLGGAIDGGDASRGVEREHARGHCVEHRLRVAAPLLHLFVLGLEVTVSVLEPCLGEGEIARHAVERIHEYAQLVVGAYLDLVVEIARGHRPRALGEHLHGLGDTPSEVEAEPRGGEDDDEGHEEEEQDVDALEGLAEQTQLLVLLEGLADAA